MAVETWKKYGKLHDDLIRALPPCESKAVGWLSRLTLLFKFLRYSDKFSRCYPFMASCMLVFLTRLKYKRYTTLPNLVFSTLSNTIRVTLWDFKTKAHRRFGNAACLPPET